MSKKSPSEYPRVLPPDVSAAAFDQAIAAFEKAIGAEWVHYLPEQVAPYYDAFPVKSDHSFAPAAVLFPGTTEEVQAIVRIANEFLIPLHAFSTGKNLGYGGASPRVAGSVVLHLGKRMNRVLELSEKYGYAVLEPGVTFFELHNAIQEKGYKLWIDAPDLSWGSVVGNMMDRGVGYTPYGNHSLWKAGLEVVLPDGDLMRTGLSGLPGSNAGTLFAAGFGPSPDNLFEQSNFGIVTKLGIQLMPAPPDALTFQITFDKAEDLEAIIDTMLPLRIGMEPLQNVPVLRNIFLEATQVSKRIEWTQDSGPISDAIAEKMKQKLGLGYWNMYATVYGPRPAIEERLRMIKDAFLKIPGSQFHTIETRPLSDDDLGAHTLHDRHKINTGVPTIEEANLMNWIPNGGHFCFSPISAPDGQDAMKQFLSVKKNPMSTPRITQRNSSSVCARCITFACYCTTSPTKSSVRARSNWFRSSSTRLQPMATASTELIMRWLTRSPGHTRSTITRSGDSMSGSRTHWIPMAS